MAASQLARWRKCDVIIVAFRPRPSPAASSGLSCCSSPRRRPALHTPPSPSRTPQPPTTPTRAASSPGTSPQQAMPDVHRPALRRCRQADHRRSPSFTRRRRSTSTRLRAVSAPPRRALRNTPPGRLDPLPGKTPKAPHHRQVATAHPHQRGNTPLFRVVGPLSLSLQRKTSSATVRCLLKGRKYGAWRYFPMNVAFFKAGSTSTTGTFPPRHVPLGLRDPTGATAFWVSMPARLQL